MTDTVEIVMIFGPDGSLQAGIPDGLAFEEAVPVLREFMATLKIDKLPVMVRVGDDIERHKHGPEAATVRADGTHAHQ